MLNFFVAEGANNVKYLKKLMNEKKKELKCTIPHKYYLEFLSYTHQFFLHTCFY